MSEANPFHILFNRLQTRYPGCGLVTELVQVEAGQFVVRALVQLSSGSVLATGMAAAADIQAAEDQARLRALQVVGIESPVNPSATLTPPSPNLQAQLLSSPLDQGDRATLTDPLPTVTPPLPTAIPSAPTPAPAMPPVEPPPAPPTPESTAAPLPESTPTATSPPPGLDVPESTTAAPKGDRPKPTRPKKAAADDTSSPPPTEDLSNLIAMTDVELERAGWDSRRGRQYLKETYNAKSRSELSEEQLLDFLHFLKALPSAYNDN